MATRAALAFLGALSVCSLQAQALMPWPASIQPQAGATAIDTSFSAAVSGAGAGDPRVTEAVRRTFARLARQTGLPLLPRNVAVERATLRIVVEQKDHRPPQRLGDDERYSLLVDGARIRLSADHPLGVLRGLETFLQLVGPSSTAAGFAVPNLEIRDEPRFPWRGLSLDVSRHFIPVDGILRTIDGMAAVKLNVLHWHLSDDQGFRVESKRYPRLQREGSDGQFYTQAEIREVISYAGQRGIRIVPEFDIPGHSTSWLAGYPELGSRPGPFQIVREYGDPFGAIDPTKESTYRFLDGFLGEMTKLFPDDYFHIGGDEVDPKQWNTQPHIREYMKLHRLANAAELQAYFNQRVQKMLTRYRKRMVGWDEILAPRLPKDVVIQSWRGQKSLAEAARKNYVGILSAGYYLDLMRPASEHYAADPLKGETADLSPAEQKRVLGGEAAMWEELATAENIDAKLWPRLAAIAERLWSPESVTDTAAMYQRLDQVNRWLEWLGLTQRSNLVLMRRRLAGSIAMPKLEAFASILEPVKGYERHRNHYGASSPFNHLVDAIPPESDAAREFRDAAERYLAAPGAPAAESLAKQLAAWERNAAEIQPLLESNPLLAENALLAAAVASLCKAGEEALSYREAAAPVDWKPRALATVMEANTHRANLLIAIAPAVQKLVEAAR
ncbi:MAG: beta-N-acetylhexosaminidase [Terriglobia bacterium]|nr:MAG: beta-N-acetylhexosaminidase [Terriglobia bacterium]